MLFFSIRAAPRLYSTFLRMRHQNTPLRFVPAVYFLDRSHNAQFNGGRGFPMRSPISCNTRLGAFYDETRSFLIKNSFKICLGFDFCCKKIKDISVQRCHIDFRRCSCNSVNLHLFNLSSSFKQSFQTGYIRLHLIF